ncbi:sensor histidine kinase [Blastococcus sp. TF02A-26]|uniref:sensor histidine kinase n=1 Tax=Blastococcus sp. TF02A-26 TaxID=2250577 RepID=UPI000DEB8DF4|nr:histidine kinase [Blastococcus sp. TF02A-26]RBY81827.1 sensor histidine kinase [Blastococcus sp. TF02A-26]
MTGLRGDWRRQWTDHPYVVDTLLAVLVLTVSLQPLLRQVGCGCEAVPLWGYALVVGECLPLVWRRRFPFTVALACGVLTTVHGLSDVPDPAVFFAGLVALYSVAAHGSRRLALLAAGTAVVAISLSLVVDRADADLEDFTIPALTFAAAWLLGDGARNRRLAAVRAEERAASLERTRAAEARQAVVEERNRIAREMHDVLAHSVSMMVVQAEAGPVVVERDPARAIQAFDAISATGRSALTELRRLLGVLREDVASPLAPQPGLAQVPELVGTVRSAGVDVDLRITGELPPASSTIDLAGYRIVQEALTNVVKHAGPARVVVRVEVSAGRLLIDVADDGLGTTASTEAGRGLLGMHERAAAAGGTVTAGPSPDGGWRVRAELPLTPVRQP